MRLLDSWRAVWVVALLGFAGVSALAAQPRLVADLNRQRVDARLQPFQGAGVEHEGVLYFPAHDPQHGYELWRSDGSPAGTYRLVDLCPGICSGVESRPLGSFHGSLYFQGNDSEHGSEIWRTDGTVGGEELLADLCPGECWGSPYSWVEWRGAVWFLLQPAFDAPVTLWTSDGTREGTRQVASLCTDLGLCTTPEQSPFLSGPDPSGQGLLVWTYGYALESLARTDGTAGGTALLHRFVEGFQYIDQVPRSAAPGVPLYFLDNAELWTSDGTPAGTRLVRSLVGLVDNYDLQSFEVVGGIYHATFLATNQWLRSDGTAAGTFVLARADPDTDTAVAHIGSTLFVVTSDGIWRTGGSPETTVRFDGPVGPILNVVEGPDRLFVLAFDQEQTVVWTTDGTPAGTRKIRFGRGPSLDEYGLTGFKGGALITRGLHELWRIDRTGSQVERLHDFLPANGGSGPIEQVVLDNRLLFFSQIDAQRSRLFFSDGTAAGTSRIGTAEGVGVGVGVDSRRVFNLTRAGDRAYFNNRGRLWSTDGTPEGTRSFKPRSSFYEGFGMNAPIGVLGGQFIYSATLDVNDAPHCAAGDSEPWTTDGVHGTKRLLNLNPFFQEPYGICSDFAYSSSPGPGVVLGGIALFAANDFVHGRELFATDGTREGTRLVADIDRDQMPYDNSELEPHLLHSIGIGSDPTDLVRAGTNVFFVADDGRTGRELWISNGNRRGTRQVADLVPGRVSSTPRNLVVIDDDVYFFAAHGADGEGEGLYRSDGTPDGTVLISDLAGVSQARDLTALKTGRLYFAAFTEAAGTELWTSQGTAETTRLVADLRPGLRGSAPQNLKAVAGKLVFAADDGTTGLEPWTSDGTPEGTIRLGDLSPGPDASTPGPFSVANGQILFGADDGEHGRELWSLPVAEVAVAAVPRD
ncbi:MAG TPA: hypothetical protein VN783_12115 [Thermoanaerobaculia bacterium]|nr:hypothetical protein [Thermoanaerobaculia bacterium]